MKLFYLLFLSFIIWGCEKNEIYTENCGITLEGSVGLRIVKSEIDEYSCITNIYSGSLEGQSVYVASVVDPACQTNGAVGVYNCSGEFIDNIKPDFKLKIGEILADNRAAIQNR